MKARWRLFVLVPLLASACVIVRKTSVEEVALDRPTEVRAPLRAFVSDGSVLVFDDGAAVSDAAVVGIARRYDLAREPMGPAAQVAFPLDSLLGIESFDEWTDPGLTLLASIGTTALAVGGTVALICAADPKCFGSCPTVYTSAGTEDEVLEAETFSYSISPLLEGRDLDRLSAVAGADGSVDLEIRNEALETHFINHLELVEVRHQAGESVLPDHAKVPAVVGRLHSLSAVADRSGRDVSAELAERDGRVYSSPSARVAATTTADHRDWIEATIPATDADTVAVVLRLRNSLLTTVLFYEFMMARQGAGALDWIAGDIERIGPAVELGSWFHRTMGLHVELETPEGFRPVARVGDTGPIAWNEVVVRIPTTPGRPARIRLSFLTDAWRIDRMAWSPEVRRPAVRELGPAEVRPLIGGGADDLVGRIAEADERYLVTGAGTAFTVRFRAEPLPADQPRTFLLASQGYYTEWVRPSWIRWAEAPVPFEPSDETIPELMARWLEVMEPMESAFHETRIPVR